MTTKRQKQDSIVSLPMWLRVAALVSILFFAVGAVAQVVHVHGMPSASTSNGKQSHTSQDDCQLCVAMHSAFVTPTQVAPEPVALTRWFAVATSEVARSFLWQAVQACRPPPVLSSAKVFAA